jgi:hypothetical protein
MERKTTINIPDAYLPLVEDIRLLQSDSCNPNVTTLRQQEQMHFRRFPQELENHQLNLLANQLKELIKQEANK